MAVTWSPLFRAVALFPLILFPIVPMATGVSDPVFSPLVVETANAWTDETNNISWSSLPAGGPYMSNTVFRDGGLAPLHAMCAGFLSVVQPNAFPIDIVTSAVKGEFDIAGNYMQLVNYMMGFAICFALGILSMLIVPLVGCCFCCCRLCGNCGGKRLQRLTEHATCRKICFSVVLLVMTGFMGAGAACMLVTNDVMKDGMQNLGSAFPNIVHDMNSYVTNTLQEIEFVAVGGYSFTQEVLQRDLNNIGSLLGVPARDELNQEGGIDTALRSITDFEAVINMLGDDMEAVNRTRVRLVRNGEQLARDLEAARIKTELALSQSSPGDNSLDTNLLKMDANFSTLPDMTDELTLLDDVRSQDLSQQVQQNRKEFDNIPWRVVNDTMAMRASISDLLDDFNTELESSLTGIRDVSNMVSDVLDPLGQQVGGYTSLLTEYDQLRWYALLGLSSLVLLIVFLQCAGLTCGLAGSCRGDVKPTERGCVSNCGGKCLMAATGFIFLFSWLLTFLVSLLFIAGGNLETMLCRPLLDPQYKILQQIDGPGGMFNGYVLGNMLFGDPTINLTFPHVLNECEKNKGAFEALQFDRKFDIKALLDWKKHIDLDTEIDNLNIDLSDVTIISADTEKQLRDFSESTQLDYESFKDELSKNTTAGDLDVFTQGLRALAAISNNSAALLDAAESIDNVSSGIYQTVRNDQEQLLLDMDALQASAANIPVTVNTTLEATKTSEEILQTRGSDIIKEEATNYKDRLVDVIESFVNYAYKSVTTDIGGCRPVHNVYVSLVEVAICKYTVQTLNGFWFALGMCVFFMMPSTIFNVKLAKYFRRMKHIIGEDPVTELPKDKWEDGYAGPEVVPGSGKEPFMGKNKVAPMW